MKNVITAESGRNELLQWFFKNADENPLLTSLFITPTVKKKFKFIYILEGKKVTFAELESKIAERIINILLQTASLDASRAKTNLLSADLDLTNEDAVGFGVRSVWKMETLPSASGVSLNLRRQPVFPVDFINIGFLENQRADIIKGLIRREGLIVVSGAAGDGKTNTIEAIVKQFEKLFPGSEVVEIGEPVEVLNPERNQINFNRSENDVNQPLKSLISYLDAIVRTEPDLIVLNNFRAETEEIKFLVKLANTGSMIICEMHGSSVEETISRLLANSDSPDYLAKALNTVICQTLINLEFDRLPSPDSITRHRTAVTEVLHFNQHLKSHLRRVADARKLVNLAKDKDGFLELPDVLAEKIKNGEKFSQADVSYIESLNR